MIDRDARDALAKQLRQLLAGLISNTEFEQRVPISQDFAISNIYLHGAMWLYSHFETHKLTGVLAQPKQENGALRDGFCSLKRIWNMSGSIEQACCNSWTTY